MSVCQLPCDSLVVYRLKNRNEDDDNCVITNYYQHGPCNIDQYVMMELLMVIVRLLSTVWLDYKHLLASCGRENPTALV